ncbi:suppressor of fused homolog [Liolophura sinensis]|uniref:suppressor of fused homolog n=1 Tax=Liolophura sinensis TaxID=3198878 RepID=UPI0031585BF7
MAGKQEEAGVSLNAVSYRVGDGDFSGLEAIDKQCSELYPDQLNPFQATTLVKFWMGGSDPLDYISMYSNDGDDSKGIPCHWHYVTYGFSDLYGDGRVHQTSGPGQPSGFGFELTFRLKKEANEGAAPMWPAQLMNRLAKYVFQTGNVLHTGDHIPWNKSLNGKSASKIRHMLITDDQDLPPLSTKFGTVEFRQVVGVMDDEVKAAQRWRGAAVIDLIASLKRVGRCHITDMKRQKSVFDVKPDMTLLVKEGIERDGSSLGHVTALCSWCKPGESVVAPSGSQKSKAMSNSHPSPAEVEKLDSAQLRFDAEAAELLPLVVKARLKKGRFFIFHSGTNHTIHLIPSGMKDENVVVTLEDPLVAQGSYLQVYCSRDLLDHMCTDLEKLNKLDQVQHFPVEFKFADPSIVLQVYKRGELP